jgi:hypothetical protein
MRRPLDQFETGALAKYQKVNVKLSASPGLSREPIRSATWRYHIKRVFDACGRRRSYWGTDLTNTYPKGSYRQRISHFYRTTITMAGRRQLGWPVWRSSLKRFERARSSA